MSKLTELEFYKRYIKENIDVLEDTILKIDRKILEILLEDKTTLENIIWATDNYENYGGNYYHYEKITVDIITGMKINIIKPRITKSIEVQRQRVKEKAEVFTSSWVCNHQNNLVDENWFGEKNIFNFEYNDGWVTNHNKIKFNKKSWKEYVLDKRLEVSCGEAPYLVSRYDTVSGKVIDPSNRIGILDRKIRVINENTNTKEEWIKWVTKAFQSTYGFEWQGDSLLIARENLLYTFIDYYFQRYNKIPKTEILLKISEIISWNIWQMDGLKLVVPMSCEKDRIVQYNLFDEPIKEGCNGCKNSSIKEHNGIYSIIKNWEKNESIKVVDLIKSGGF